MEKRYRIGEIAKIKNIDAQTLRYYDQMGILTPKIVDEKNNYRYYSIEQFIEVDRIKFYRLLGLSLEEIRRFKEIRHVDEALKTLKSQKSEIESKIYRLQAIEKNIKNIIDTIEETNETTRYQIEIRNCDSIYGIIGECHTNKD